MLLYFILINYYICYYTMFEQGFKGDGSMPVC